MICEHCKSENISIENEVVDYYDPGDYFGHGQYEVEVAVCDDCGTVQEDIPEDYVDDYDALLDQILEGVI